MPPKEEEKKGDSEPEAKPSPEVGKMKRGDYVIHVFIEQGKQIRLAGAATVDPIIEISCLNVKKFTTSKNDIGPTGVEVEDIEEGKLTIRVLNKGFFKEDTIGVYEFDITQIYFQKDHAMMHQWLALSNPEGQDFNDITCYLKISISISGPGDEQIQLSEDNSVEGTDSAVVMMPASIKKQYKQLFFRILRAEKLPKMDRFGTIDAYLKTTFFKQSLKTEVVTMKDNLVSWDQELLLPIQWPVASNRLVFKLYDYDAAGSDELVGSMIFSIKEIVSVTEPTFNWINLYGAPQGCSGANTDKMKNHPEFASTWKGRILVQYQAEETKHPEMKIQPVSNQHKQDAAKWAHPHEFELIAEIGSGICLPDSKKYKIMIAINDFTMITEGPLEYKENYCRWNKRFDQQVLSTCYVSLEDLDRIYVYLMDGDDPVCYWKGDCKDFENPDPEFIWHPFSPDLAVGKVKEQFKAGMFQMKLSINDKTKNGPRDFKAFKAWMKPPPKRLSSWKIRCYIYQCKDLPAADSEGSSDPYIEAWSTDKNKQKTPVVEDNCNPIFFSTLEIYADFSQPSEAPPIVLNIWDKDEGILDSDDFIGRAVIFLKDAVISQDDTIPPIPKWHKVVMGFSDNEPSIGEILVSFSVVADDYRFKVPIEYMDLTESIEFKEYNIEINCLGLRNMQSFGLMPVKKPFIKFNIRSLLPPEKAKAIQNVQTNPQETGPNPNINTTVSFTMMLPASSLFCPKLACDAYDYLFKGLTQPILGTFSIPIGQILDDTNKYMIEEMEQSDHIIKELKRVMAQGGRASSNRNSFGSDREEIKEENKGPADPNDIKIFDKAALTPIKEGDSPDTIKNKKISIGKSLGTALGSNFKKTNQLELLMQNDMRGKLAEAKVNMAADAKQELKDQRLKDQETLKATGVKVHKNVFLPKYALDERLKIQREVEPPPPSLFIGLGFNEKPEESKKHYRRYYPDELENVKEVMPKLPFHESQVVRGQQRGASAGLFGGLFGKANTDDTGQVSTIKKVGKFKGIINVYNAKENADFKAEKKSRDELIKKLIRDIYQKKTNEVMTFDFDKIENAENRGKFIAMMEKIDLADLQLAAYLVESDYEERIMRMMMSKTKSLVRLYVIEGFNFSQRDIGSFSDPYLKLTCGKKVYNEKDNYQLDQPNPKFHKHFDFDVEFPGAPPLVIQAYDYDDLFGDDIIGETIVDLDDRFFSSDWQSLKDKPVEYRELSISSSTVTQGVIKCWVEIFPTSKSTGEDKLWDITPRPQKDYEVRVVVWDTKDIVGNDAGLSDIYFRAFFDTKDSKETDTHYRCSTGKGSFNYRLLFKHSAPCENYNLTFQGWDRDFFKSNDLIGEAAIDLKYLLEDVIETGRSIALNKKYYTSYLQGVLPPDLKIDFQDEDSFWIPCKTLDEKTKALKNNGFVRVSITVMPKTMADANKVGEARNDPNHDPFLPPPTGRISFSLNPFAMLGQLLGPEIMRKVYMMCCCGLCLTLCVVMFPMIFSNLVSQAIMNIF